MDVASALSLLQYVSCSLLIHVADMAQFEDVKEAGQTLENIAMGVAAPKVPDLLQASSTPWLAQAAASQTASTADVAKLVGSIVTSPVDLDYKPQEHQDTVESLVGLPVDPTLGWQLDTTFDANGYPLTQPQYWPVLQSNSTLWDEIEGTWGPKVEITAQMTNAFQGLIQEGELSFTVSWWAYRTNTREVFALSNSTEPGIIDDEVGHGRQTVPAASQSRPKLLHAWHLLSC